MRKKFIMGNICIQCNKEPIAIQKRGLCKQCYHKEWRQSKKISTKPNWVVRHGKEVEFIRNYFTHKNWLYHPVIFRLNGCNYEPDFYDGNRDVFIEVTGTRQAFYANFEKYKLFINTFPKINFEIRNSEGEIRLLNKRACAKKKPNKSI